MQRVRIGLTGLSCVFLLILLAAAIVGFRHEEPTAPGDVTGRQGNASADAPKDPLAELGVAPGGTPDKGIAPPR